MVSRPPAVFLVGFMGSGKTSVGQALAAHLALPFIDLDARVEQAAGKSVSAIFAHEGEAAFRAHERAMLLALAPELAHGAVVATGGGTAVDPAARAFMREHGTTIWLDTPLETIERRVPRDGSRPLFGDPAALAALYEERRSHYASAGRRVDAGKGAPEDLARAIARDLEERA